MCSRCRSPPPHPHRHPDPSFMLTSASASPSPSSSQAHGARGFAAPDPAGCPDPAIAPGGRRPRGRGRSTRRVLPPVVAARPHAGSALRRVTPATRRLRGPRAGTERESRVDASTCAPHTRCVGPRHSAAHARGRVPANTHPPLWAMPTVRRPVAGARRLTVTPWHGGWRSFGTWLLVRGAVHPATLQHLGFTHRRYHAPTLSPLSTIITLQ